MPAKLPGPRFTYNFEILLIVKSQSLIKLSIKMVNFS